MECDFCGSKKFGCIYCNPNYTRQMAAIHIGIAAANKSTRRAYYSDLPWTIKEKVHNAKIAYKDISYKKSKNAKKISKIKLKLFKIKKQINVSTDKRNSLNKIIKRRKHEVKCAESVAKKCRLEETKIEFNIWSQSQSGNDYHMIDKEHEKLSRAHIDGINSEYLAGLLSLEIRDSEKYKSFVEKELMSNNALLKNLDKEFDELMNQDKYYEKLIHECTDVLQ